MKICIRFHTWYTLLQNEFFKIETNGPDIILNLQPKHPNLTDTEESSAA